MTTQHEPLEPLFVKPADAARLLQISRAKTYQLISQGAIPSRRIGGSIRVPLAALREMAAGLEHDGRIG